MHRHVSATGIHLEVVDHGDLHDAPGRARNLVCLLGSDARGEQQAGAYKVEELRGARRGVKNVERRERATRTQDPEDGRGRWSTLVEQERCRFAGPQPSGGYCLGDHSGSAGQLGIRRLGTVVLHGDTVRVSLDDLVEASDERRVDLVERKRRVRDCAARMLARLAVTHHDSPGSS